jgi:hypothetical protein
LEYYDSNGTRIVTAIDFTTWATKWIRESYETPVIALDGGHVVFSDVDTSSLIERDETGTPVATTPTEAVVYETMLVLRGQGTLHGTDSQNMVLALSVPHWLESIWSVLKGIFNQCTDPKLLADYVTSLHIGLLPRAAPYTYRFEDFLASDPRHWNPDTNMNSIVDPDEDQKAGVEEAFARWNAVSTERGLGTTFRALTTAEDQAGTVAEIILRKTDPLTFKTLDTTGGFNGVDLLPNHRARKGVIFFTYDPLLLLTRKGYYKIGLHELGHSLGLDHPWAPADPMPRDYPIIRGGTVMNNPGRLMGGKVFERRDDYIRNIPLSPTACDIKGVLDASTR